MVLYLDSVIDPIQLMNIRHLPKNSVFFVGPGKLNMLFIYNSLSSLEIPIWHLPANSNPNFGNSKYPW